MLVYVKVNYLLDAKNRYDKGLTLSISCLLNLFVCSLVLGSECSVNTASAMKKWLMRAERVNQNQKTLKPSVGQR